MALDPTSVIKLFTISMLFPASGFVLTEFVKKKFFLDPRYIDILGLIYATYISYTWRIVLENSLVTRSPILRLPLGQNLILIIIYTAFASGTLLQIAYERFNLEEKGQKLMKKRSEYFQSRI